MPLYEYICKKCHKKFSEVLTIKEHETKKCNVPSAGVKTWNTCSNRSLLRQPRKAAPGSNVRGALLTRREDA